jgi:hypothetical protein
MCAVNSLSSKADRFRTAAVLCGLLLNACRTAPLPPDPAPPPSAVAESIPAHQRFDHRPYEFIWSDRHITTDQLMDFEQLLGWIVETPTGVTASLNRSDDQQLFGQYTSRITYTAPSNTWLILRPPYPLRVTDPVASATAWIQAPQQPTVTLLTESAAGTALPIALGQPPHPYWHLLRRALPPAFSQADTYPLTCTGLKISHLPPATNGVLYIDAVSVLTQPSRPLDNPRRPQRPLPLTAGQNRGLNTGDGTLTFPTRPQTILPPAANQPDPIRIAAQPDGTYHLTSDTPAPHTGWRIRVADGLQVSDLPATNQTANWTIQLVLDAPAAGPAGNPVVLRADPTQWHIEYTNNLQFQLALYGDSLVIDIAHRGGTARALQITSPIDPDTETPLALPFLTSADLAIPPVRLKHTATGPRYLHLQLDPYRSNSSALSFDAADHRLTARYHPGIDQPQRSDLHERLVISVSDQLEHVLPSAPNPVAPHANPLHDRILNTTPDTPPHPHLLTLLDHTIWSRGDASRSFRLRPDPFKGDIDHLRQTIASQQTNGTLVALYQQVRALSPLNAAWNPEHILLDRDGEWIWQANGYLARPGFRLDWISQHAATLRQRYNAAALFLADHGTTPPWTAVDYDPRSRATAHFSQALFADGELLHLASTAYAGPILIEADTAPLYAGLADGLIVGGNHLQITPWLPAYKLLRLHTNAVFFGAGDWPTPLTEAALDRYLASQLAYGQAGRLAADPNIPDAWTQRSLYTMLAPQRRYLTQPPVQIRYHDGNQFLPVDAALTNHAGQLNRLYIEYPGQVEVRVNGSPDQHWIVQSGNDTYTLPPFGWLVTAPDCFAFSGLVNGQRVDYVESPDYLYFDPRGQPVTFRGLRSDRPLLFP